MAGLKRLQINMPLIRQLAVLNRQLVQKSLNLGIEASQLEYSNQYLRWLLLKAEIDFISQITSGRTLLLGEGNFSFALQLVKNTKITPHRIVATTFEDEGKLTDEALQNAKLLGEEGALVLHNVDATNLQRHFGGWLFDNIIFQFPHTGSREAIEGRNPNFILVRNFLQSAATQLRWGGQVLITIVDSAHYRGAFQLEEAAKFAGFKEPNSFAFNPFKFEGYEHTMNHQNESALHEHDQFRTWIFRR